MVADHSINSCEESSLSMFIWSGPGGKAIASSLLTDGAKRRTICHHHLQLLYMQHTVFQQTACDSYICNVDCVFSSIIVCTSSQLAYILIYPLRFGGLWASCPKHSLVTTIRTYFLSASFGFASIFFSTPFFKLLWRER